VLPADALEAKVDVKEGLEGDTDEPVDERVGAMQPGAPVKLFKVPSAATIQFQLSSERVAQ
jgi:hypothetical protein